MSINIQPTHTLVNHFDISYYLREGSLNFKTLPPLSLYIHIPWCLKKCPYCDFNSHSVTQWAGELPEIAYVDALLHDLTLSLPLIWGRPIHSIFIGGGTPSIFSVQALDRLLCGIRSLVQLPSHIEITLEANPGTFEIEKFKGLREIGINRLSVGIQSFNPKHLSSLGRVHDGNEALKAAEIAVDVFDNVNFDIMFALPEQNLSELRQDVETALQFQPNHVSLYHLTLEPNTYFHRYPPNIPDEDTAADMQDLIWQTLAQAGYDHYEVSAYAKPNQRSQHNLNYWLFGDYLGIGAGAHSKLTFPHRVIRQMRYKQPKSYLDTCQQGQPIQEHLDISRHQLPFEFMLNALRLHDGFESSLFYDRTSLLLNSIDHILTAAQTKGLLEVDFKQIKPTELGQRFLNDLQSMFLETSI